MVASAIFILDGKGKVLISRNYRGDIPMTAIERFPKLVAEQEEDNTVTPVIQDDNVTFVFIKHSNIYVVSTTNKNSNTMMLISFMHSFCQVLTQYFTTLEEESIRDNFVVIYELMDELIDYGYPQFTDSKILQEFITQDSHKLAVQVRPPATVTGRLG